MKKNKSGPESAKPNMCLSCGTIENMGKRRYCSIDCRQRLRYKLDMRTGLLKALYIRYTETFIIIDLLPFSCKEIYSFIFPRSGNNKPADDFSKMADILGNAWWTERKRTNRKYLASRHVLEKANRKNAQADSVKPLEIKIPVIKEKSLIHLKIGRSELNTPQLQKLIKSAYRTQAKKHHPDLGGDTDAFRKIHRAYEELVSWAESPTFVERRGFPDKWFYDGDKNRWVQPTPHTNIR
ncbi:MAG: DnaJ domain-containing protein [Thermodesulfobacteriota bacterium]|nr:DnaJ domain-containing protein [Thermodesulfobacteriota bacterium]